MRRYNFLAYLLAFLLLASKATSAEREGMWDPLRFLIGDWEAKTKSGEAKGQFTFSFDLQTNIIVRRNHAEYPAANGRSASMHDDLMIIYREGAPSLLHAIYFDIEDHVIHYAVQTTRDAKVMFVSEAIPDAPRYRLSYDRLPDGNLHGKFEIAPPGKPESFSKYLEWEAQRPAEGKGQRP
jgi:hypothetical protein